jgi:CysZ protein
LKLLAGQPRLWWLCLGPFLINLGLFVLFFWLGYGHLQSWVSQLVPDSQQWWWQALAWLLMLLLVLTLLLVEVYLFVVVGRVVAAPFLELLTRRVERLSGVEGWPREPGVLASMGRALGHGLVRLGLFGSVMLPLWLLGLFLPGLGSLVASLLAWVITCFFLAGEFLDYPLERRGLSFWGKLGYVRRLGLTALAFGAAVFVLGAVPVLNLALLPLAAVGGTLLYLERSPA